MAAYIYWKRMVPLTWVLRVLPAEPKALLLSATALIVAGCVSTGPYADRCDPSSAGYDATNLRCESNNATVTRSSPSQPSGRSTSRSHDSGGHTSTSTGGSGWSSPSNTQTLGIGSGPAPARAGSSPTGSLSDLEDRARDKYEADKALKDLEGSGITIDDIIIDDPRYRY